LHEDNAVENLSRNRRATVAHGSRRPLGKQVCVDLPDSSSERDKSATKARQVFHKGPRDVTGVRRTTKGQAGEIINEIEPHLTTTADEIKGTD
jgi:hypothetical protein